MESFSNGDSRAEPFDLAISEFIKAGGCKRLLWYIVREKQLLNEVQKESKIDNDDALSNAQSSMSTASAGGASVMSKLNDDDSRESHSTTSSAAAQQRIIVSTDQLHTLEQYNCVYFLRDPSDPSPITEENISARVVCGMIRESKAAPSFGNQLTTLDLLGSLTSTLERIVIPMLKSKTDYGDLTRFVPNEDATKVAEVASFLAKVEQFRAAIASTVDSLQLTVSLQKPTRRFCIDFNSKSFQKAGMKREVVECYESTVNVWMKRISKVLTQGTLDAPLVDASATDHSNFGDDDGPDVELEFWKKRTTLLNHITDNLQLKANKTILGVLMAAGTRAAQVVQDWGEMELRVTEAANEAKDNAKYLLTLERFAEPLFATTPDMNQIRQSLPAIINVIRMIHSISKFYNTSERLTGLFIKTTNQIIKCCRRYLERKSSLWEGIPEVVVEDLRACIELKEMYVFHYRQTKGELAANPMGPQFDFPEAGIFGKFDLFSARLCKLVDVMHVTRQFDKLRLANIEHVQPLCLQYKIILQQLREQAGDYLEARRREFDNRYQEYKYKVQELSTELVVFLNNCFLTVTNTAKALQLLSRFRAVLNNSHITQLLEEKHVSIFMSYGRDLENIKGVYERNKEAPPAHRDTPPIAGAISWVRQLQRKIEGPMKVFQETPELLHSRDAKRIIKTYNKVAKTFVTYEARWYTAWATRLVDDAKEGLQATLLVCDKSSGRVYVNFDISIRQLCREVHCLLRLGLPIPPEAKSIHSQKDALLSYSEELHFLVDRYYALIESITKLHSGIMIPHVNRLNIAINPGLVQLTWTSLNIKVYMQEAAAMLTEVEKLVQRVNGVLKHRVEASCNAIKRLSFICLADDLTLPNTQAVPATTIAELISLQRRHAKHVSHRISVLNCEVATATREIVQITTQKYTQAELARVQEAQVELHSTFEHEVFQAILFAMQQSVLYLKTRITGPCSRGNTGPSAFLHPVPTMFHAELVVKLRAVDFSPSLEELQKGVNKMARSMLDAARGVYRWKQDGRAPHTYDIVEYQSAVLRTEALVRNAHLETRLCEQDSGSDSDTHDLPPKSKLKSLFLRIGKNRKMTKVFLQLTGAVSSLQGQLASFLQQFACYDTLLRGNRANELETFNAQEHMFEDYEDHIRTFHTLEREIALMPNNHSIGCLRIDLARIKHFLSSEASEWKKAYGVSLNAKVKEELDCLIHNMEDIEAKLNRKVHDLSDVNGIMCIIAKMRSDESEIEMRLSPIVSAYEVLYKYGVNVTKEEQDHVDRIGFQWNDLASQSRKIMDQLQDVGPRFKSVLLHDVVSFQNQVLTFKADYEKNGPMAENIEPRLAVERLKVFEKQFVECKRKLQEYAMGERLFGLPPTRYKEVELIEKELKLLARLYDLYTEVLAKKTLFEEMPWIEADVEKLRTTIKAYHERVKKMPGAVRDWYGYKELRAIIDDLLDTVPILELLTSRCVVERHWEKLSEATGANLNPRLPEFRLKNVLEAKLINFKSEVEEITTAALKEHDIEVKLGKIKEHWSAKEVTLQNFKQRGLLMLQPDATTELISCVEEAQTVLTTLLSSRFNEPFKKDIMLWISKLTTTQERIGEWLEVQHLWIYMEAVFSGSGDIGKEMPSEVKRFSNIDRQWTKIMKSAADTPNALKLCVHSDMLSNLLPHLRLYLDMCQKSLSGYLASKRSVQPRFYFVSNAQLLEILGQACNPVMIQHHLASITNNVVGLMFDDTRQVKGFVSAEGEEMLLESSISTDCDVVDWSRTLLDRIAKTLKEKLRAMNGAVSVFDTLTASNAASGGAASSAQTAPVRTFFESFPSQLTILGLQLTWTADCELVLSIQKSEKSHVANKVRKHKYLYEALLLTVRDPSLTSRQRIGLEAMVILQAHQFDLILTLQKSFKKVRSTADFEWLKQTRTYWKLDRDTCLASITDVDFEYGFEYVGSVDRLVITDLTDRIYISSAQAVGMGYGAAPLGPAGTGKTETIKGMGKSFGRYVVITNCSELMSIHTIANMIKGTATSGCWCVFHEIDSVMINVLSVVAAQIATVLHGKRNRQAEILFTDDSTIALSPFSTVFITTSPEKTALQGRVKLPENMSALFRNIAVASPDRHAIIRVKLAAAGFLEAVSLARKFSALYTLCEEQLGRHTHYDFGLRNVMSVLRRCGLLLRESPVPRNQKGMQRGATSHTDIHSAGQPAAADAFCERNILVTALREVNLAKLVDEDTLLFCDLLADVFPGAETKTWRKEKFHQIIAKEIHNNDFTQSSEWMAKILQASEQLNSRHGVCIVGPSAGGKTSILHVLSQAISTIQETQIRVSRINPKTITVMDLYGQHDPQTGDWSDGIFTALWRRATRRSEVLSWIVMDGPIDPLWVESLNTVLDDTKLLTIPNNERLPLKQNLSLLFEVEDVKNASPSTVSRLGMVYVGARCLPWNALLDSWLLRHRQVVRSHAQTILDLFTSILPGLLTLVQTECMLVVPFSDQGIVLNILKLNEGLFSEAQGRVVTAQTPLAKLSLFAIGWGVGGLLGADREKIEPLLRASGIAPEGAFFDHYVDTATGQWEPWSVRDEDLHASVDVSIPIHRAFVPTPHTLCYQYLLHAATCPQVHFASHLRNAMVLGEYGIGKTSLVNNMLHRPRADKSEATIAKYVSLTHASTPQALQTSFESYVEKISGSNWGPPPGNTLYIFLDDCNVPQEDVYGDQPALELIRQFVHEGSFYSRVRLENAEKLFVSCTHVIGAATTLMGYKAVPSRMKQYFYFMNVTTPSQECVLDVMSHLLGLHFNARNGFCAAVTDSVSKISEVLHRLWVYARTSLRAIPALYHYRFSLEDFKKVATVMSHGGSDVITDLQTFVDLFEHETCRVFMDKVTEQSAAMLYTEFSHSVDALLGKKYSENLRGANNHWLHKQKKEDEDRDVIYTAPVAYSPVEWAECEETIAEWVTHYNEDICGHPITLAMPAIQMKQVVRICRCIRTPHASMLLFGVAGNGRRTLSRLSAHMCGFKLFELPMDTDHSFASFLEDLREIQKHAAITSPVVVLASEGSLANERALDVVNVLLSGGDVRGLHQKEELELLYDDIRPYLNTAHGREPSITELQNCYTERVGDNLHFILYFSSFNSESFKRKTRQFPALLKYCCIATLHNWPEDALVRAAEEKLGDLPHPSVAQMKIPQIARHAGKMYLLVQSVAEKFARSDRRKIQVPPGYYLEYLACYREKYLTTLQEQERTQAAIRDGIASLDEAYEDVSLMKRSLGDKQILLDRADVQMKSLMTDVQLQTQSTSDQNASVENTRAELDVQADRVQKEQEETMSQLAAAEPALRVAEEALSTVKQDDVTTLKRLTNAPPLIRRILDGVLLLRNLPIDSPASWEVDTTGAKVLKPSWPQGKAMACEPRFLQLLQEFPRDSVNDEHCELLAPYLSMEDFTVDRAKGACGSLAGLCTWISMMTVYHKFAKSIAPKRARLAMAESQLYKAKQLLAKSEQQLAIKQAELKEMSARLQASLEEKSDLETDAELTRKRLITAEALLTGLHSEKGRWQQDAQRSVEHMKTLAGNTARLALFTCLCPPFTHRYRTMLLTSCANDLSDREVPFTHDIDSLIVTENLKRKYELEALPLDEHCLKSAFLVQNSPKKVLITDPHGQGLRWLINSHEKQGVMLTSIRANDWLRAVRTGVKEGKTVIIEGIESSIPKVLYPLLARNYTKKTSLDGLTVTVLQVGDQEIETDRDFNIFLVNSVPLPEIHPDTFAKVNVVDFTVTIAGLTEQLLCTVIRHEKPSLEEDRLNLIEETLVCEAVIQECEDKLLQRLVARGGTRLLDDSQLIEILSTTKAKSVEIAEVLRTCNETHSKIEQAREAYRSVAQRGAVIYFTVVDMRSCLPVYQLSLPQFLKQFEYSMTAAPANQYPPKRVQNVVSFQTNHLFQYCKRGYFAQHKLLFGLLLVIGVDLEAGRVTPKEVNCLLTRPHMSAHTGKDEIIGPAWLSREAYLHLLTLDKEVEGMSVLKPSLRANDGQWQEWFHRASPEDYQIPHIGERLTSFQRLLLIHTLRPDRFVLAVTQYIAPFLGKDVTSSNDTFNDSFVQQLTSLEPILCILSRGVDVTTPIESLARANRITLTEVSLGEGQQATAMKHVHSCLTEGTWLLMHNVHLCPAFLKDFRELLQTCQGSVGASGGNQIASLGNVASLQHYSNQIPASAKIWLTISREAEVPVGLLDIAVKVAVEHPSGVRAGLLRAFQQITQDQLESIQQREWRILLYALCFFHCTVVERNKFGPIGWSTPYCFSNHDLLAATSFLHNYLYTDIRKGVSWATVQYMICGVQYGGRVSDPFDAQVLMAYGEKWFVDELFETQGGGFLFHVGYRAPDFLNVSDYRTYISSLPLDDSAEVFGMQRIAEQTSNMSKSAQLIDGAKHARLQAHTTTDASLDTLSYSISSGGVAPSYDHPVMRLIREIPTKLMRALDSIAEEKTALRGVTPISLLFQRELETIHTLVHKVALSCKELERAMLGYSAGTPELSEMFDDFYHRRVPEVWAKQSWLSADLGAWIDHAVRRMDQLHLWVVKGTLKAYWLPGFFFPQALLTALKQEFVRIHLPAATLEQVEMRAELTRHTAPDVLPATNDEGTSYIYGLHLEGATWDKTANMLLDGMQKELTASLPLVKVTCTLSVQPDSKHYYCPVFVSSRRSISGYILSIALKVCVFGGVKKNYKILEEKNK